VTNLDQQRRLWRRAGAAVAVLTLLTLTVPLASWAGGGSTFTDVSSTHPFVDEIEEVATAGVAQGFPDGTYRPSQPVTRQAMAAFLSRAGSSIAYDEAGSFTLTSESFQSVGADTTIQLPIPFDFNTNQYIHVQGSVSVYDTTPPDACDPTCVIGVRVYDVLSGESSTEVLTTLTTHEPAGDNDVMDSVQVRHVNAASDEQSRWVVQARMVRTSAAGAFSLSFISSHISVTVMPFSADFD
jgi:hypothetical protein